MLLYKPFHIYSQNTCLRYQQNSQQCMHTQFMLDIQIFQQCGARACTSVALIYRISYCAIKSTCQSFFGHLGIVLGRLSNSNRPTEKYSYSAAMKQVVKCENNFLRRRHALETFLLCSVHSGHLVVRLSSTKQADKVKQILTVYS